MKQIAEQIGEVLNEGEHLLTGLSGAQVAWRPKPGVWSIGECIDDVTMSTRIFRDCIDESVATSPGMGLVYQGATRPGALSRLTLWIMEPPIRFAKAKAPAAMSPQRSRPARLILDEFREAHERLLHDLPEFMKWDLNRTRVNSPLGLRYSLGVVLQVIPAHARRHLWQARKVAEDPRLQGVPSEQKKCPAAIRAPALHSSRFTTSTRRFRVRPSSESFGATGARGPTPCADNRAAAI